jgi:hypothetical protein
VCDALENCVLLPGRSFGVDLTAPTIVGVSPGDRAVDPAAGLAVTLEDGVSGFGAKPVLASAVRSFPGLSPEAACGFGSTPGAVVNGTCQMERSTPLVATESQPGYYTYALVAEDLAGNRSQPRVVNLLVDRMAPSVPNISFPGTFPDGEPASLSADLSDNLDLVASEFRLTYPAAGGAARVALPFAPPVAVGEAFDASLTTSTRAVVSLPFVRTLTRVEGAGRTTVLVDSVQVRALDAAGLVAAQSRGISASMLSRTTTGDPFSTVASVAASLSSTAVCVSGCLATDPTSATVTLRATGPSGYGNPFARVYFFAARAGGPVALLGVTDAPKVADTGTERTFSFSLPFTPTGKAAGELSVFAVGVSAAGSGLKTQEVSLQVIAR